MTVMMAKKNSIQFLLICFLTKQPNNHLQNQH